MGADACIPPSGPARWCAREDCKRAAWLLAIGHGCAAGDAVEIAAEMMLVAYKLDVLRGEREDQMGIN